MFACVFCEHTHTDIHMYFYVLVSTELEMRTHKIFCIFFSSFNRPLAYFLNIVRLSGPFIFLSPSLFTRATILNVHMHSVYVVGFIYFLFITCKKTYLCMKWRWITKWKPYDCFLSGMDGEKKTRNNKKKNNSKQKNNNS